MKKQAVSLFSLALLSVLFAGCSNSSSSTDTALGIGSVGPGGGTVFAFLDEANTTGLEVFPAAIGETAWGCSGVNVDADNFNRASNGVGAPTGAESSEILRTANSSGICFAEAAQLAFGFTNNGLNDWYLPSTDELITIRELGLLPGNPGDAYWSATEDTDQNAFTVLIRVPDNTFDTGEPSTTTKEAIADVVPIRTF